MPSRSPRLAIVLSEAAKAGMQALAKRNKRSTSAEIAVAIEEYLERNGVQIEEDTDA